MSQNIDGTPMRNFYSQDGEAEKRREVSIGVETFNYSLLPRLTDMAQYSTVTIFLPYHNCVLRAACCVRWSVGTFTLIFGFLNCIQFFS
jgi:hypothetical protein